MINIDESITIAKPRPEVFAFFADADNTPVYSSNLVDYTVTEGDSAGLGRKAKFAVKVVGVRLDYTDEVVEYEENEVAKLAGEGPIPYTITLTFSDDGEGTKVDWHQESESLGSVFKFADGLVVKMYSKDVRANLEKAKALLES